MVKSIDGAEINQSLLAKYFRNLVNQFYKILPMRENNEKSLTSFMKSLRIELLGLQGAIPEYCENSYLISLISILQYLIDNPECEIGCVKHNVFKAISICNKLESSYKKMAVEK